MTWIPPEEATDEMVQAVASIVGPHAAKLIWKRMLQQAYIAEQSAIKTDQDYSSRDGREPWDGPLPGSPCSKGVPVHVKDTNPGLD